MDRFFCDKSGVQTIAPNILRISQIQSGSDKHFLLDPKNHTARPAEEFPCSVVGDLNAKVGGNPKKRRRSQTPVTRDSRGDATLLETAC